jgi:hypothetical protein
MSEKQKANVFQLRRACSLSANPFFSHVFPERGHVPESAAPAARLVSYCVHGVLDTRIDDLRQAQERPPMEPKKETTKETASGIKGETSTPETGKYIGHLDGPPEL